MLGRKVGGCDVFVCGEHGWWMGDAIGVTCTASYEGAAGTMSRRAVIVPDRPCST